jgi:hypothetical protein
MFCGANWAIDKGMLAQRGSTAKDREAYSEVRGPGNVMSLWCDLRNDTF